MSLFKRDEDHQDAAKPPEPDAHDEPPPKAGPDDAEPPQGPGRDEELENALKDLAARMSTLQSNVESVKNARGDLEDKLERMESRMHRLGGLAEAVSSEYNPFLTENEPGDPDWDPRKDLLDEDAEDPHDNAVDPAAPAEAPVPAGPDEPTSSDKAPGGADAGASEDDASPPPREAIDAINVDPRTLAKARNGDDGTLRERMLLLEWVGMMLDRVGHAGLMDLMEYYERLGWVDEDTKHHALRVAIGIQAPDRVDGDGWRADLELHERSLLALQRLQGDEVSQADLEALQLDLRRLFDR